MGSPWGATGVGAAGRTGGRVGLGSVAGACSNRATMSVSTATWLVKEERLEEVETEEVLSSPISPVPWENAEESSEISFVSCAEWLRTSL